MEKKKLQNVWGAMCGDIIGSRYEFNNIKTKHFPLMSKNCNFTDDSVMTIALMKALVDTKGKITSEDAVKAMREVGQQYPFCGYGGRFFGWMFSDNPEPYGSYGNGSGMRVSSVAYVAKSLDEVKNLAYIVTSPTHNHEEGLKGAYAIATSVFLALNGESKENIISNVEKNYYTLDFTLDEIRPTYEHIETCQESVPQAIEAFKESESFEDAIRNAVSIGGDTDTIADMAGAIASAYYGLPEYIMMLARKYLPNHLLSIVDSFIDTFGE